MFKRYLKYIVFLITSFFMVGNQLNAKSKVEGETNIPLIVLDEGMNLNLPKKFRTSKYPFKQSTAPLPTRLGLDNLKIAGSGQFSKNTLNAVINELKGSVWIIDLRKESHGFVNDLPISWYSKGNQSNFDESDDNIQKQESMLFKDIKGQGEILVSQILEKESGNIIKTRQIDLKVNSTGTESTLLNNLNLGYLRIGVLDHHRPSDTAVDQFLDFTKDLPSEAWLYFHCRGGSGRTTTFMAMYDIMKNGHQVSLDNVVQRQALLGGNNLFEISQSQEDAWKKQAAIERKKFIERFYQYVNDPKGFNRKSWSQWVASH